LLIAFLTNKATFIEKLSYKNIDIVLYLPKITKPTLKLMSEELQTLQKELWKIYQVIKSINAIAETRVLTDEEKEKLKFLVQQMRSIQSEIKDEKEKNDATSES